MKTTLTFLVLVALLGFSGNRHYTFDENLKIDSRLLALTDSIDSRDTLIIYRHQKFIDNCAFYEYAYGFAYLKNASGLYKKSFELEKENKALKEGAWIMQDFNLDVLEAMREALENKELAFEEEYSSTSSDGYHDLEVYVGGSSIYAKHIKDYDLIERNRCNPNGSFIFLLRDSSQYAMPTLPYMSKATLIVKKPPTFVLRVPLVDSCTGDTFKTQYECLQRRFLRKDLLYTWDGAEWELKED